jgi:Flp pilus assembly protein TadB
MRQGHALTVFFGLWLAISPWVLGYTSHSHALLIATFGAIAVLAGLVSAVAWPTTSVPMWVAMAAGICTYLMPMIQNMSGQSLAANNDLIVGPLIGLSVSAALVGRQRRLLLAGPPDPEGAEGQASLS